MVTKPENAQHLLGKARTEGLTPDEFHSLMDSDEMAAERSRMLTVMARWAQKRKARKAESTEAQNA